MPRLRTSVVAFLACLSLATSAQGSTGTLRVVGPDGALIGQSDAAPLAWPDDGSVATIGGGATDAAGALLLEGVTALGGRVSFAIARIGHDAVMTGLTVDGVAVQAGENSVFAIPGAGWAIALQRAIVPLADGRRREASVALRIHLDEAVGVVPAGSEILIGVVASGADGGVVRGEQMSGAAAEIPPDLIPIYRAAEAAYGVPWNVLAAVNRVETSFGTDVRTSWAGAVGWMQFMPATWASYGVDGDGDGDRDPNDRWDAIFSAANLLKEDGFAKDRRGAIWLYNHSWHYVDTVLGYADSYVGATGTPVPAATDDGNAGYSPVGLW